MDNTNQLYAELMNYLSFTIILDSPEALVHKQVFNGYVKTRPVWNFSDAVDVKVGFSPIFLKELVCIFSVYYTFLHIFLIDNHNFTCRHFLAIIVSYRHDKSLV